MLKLTSVTKEYKTASSTVHALKGIDLEFRTSEFVCILGPSGCGKTTLLNIIGGLDRYTSGDLEILGRSTKNFKDRDWDLYRNHRIGFIFQSYNLIPHQTVLGNVELALTIAGVGREERRRRAAEALRRVGLSNEQNKRPNQLSGGQMQRVAIARALVNNPDILLADEPTGALDSETSVQIMDLIKEIAGERLVIMVTHNPELAYRYATRIVRLKDGLVESDSDPCGAPFSPPRQDAYTGLELPDGVKNAAESGTDAELALPDGTPSEKDGQGDAPAKSASKNGAENAAENAAGAVPQNVRGNIPENAPHAGFVLVDGADAWQSAARETERAGEAGLVSSEAGDGAGGAERGLTLSKKPNGRAGGAERGGKRRGERKRSARGKRLKKERAKMSFFTSLALSFRNLLTKKGRTILTSVAGSIGIVSVCLVLALSSGFNNYVKKTEEDMLSYYPITISESSFDLASAMTSFTAPQDMPDLSQLDDQVYIDSFLTNLANGMAAQNDISDEYLSYLRQMDPSWYAEIMYGYGVKLSDNLFLQAKTFPEGDNKQTETTTRSLSNLKSKYIADLMAFASQYDSLIGYADYFLNVVNVMPGTSDATNLGYGEYVKSQYDVVAGHFPENENEVVLVVGSNNQVTDLTLAQLGLLDENKFMDLFNLGTDNADSVADGTDRLNFNDILGKEYTLFYNDEVYTSDPTWTQEAYIGGKYKFSYQGQRANDAFAASEQSGINLKISGILRLKDGLTYGCLSSGLNLTEKTILSYIAGNRDSEIVRWMQSAESKISYAGADFYLMPVMTENLMSDYSLYEIAQGKSIYIAQTADPAVRTLGGSDEVSRVSIYAVDFDSKESILAHLDQWNADHDGSDEARAQQITYTDTVGLLMGMVQQILDIITYVLVAFTAISLVVSSVMIGIITYVSVVERVKEIGVLRSLGARKQDIRNLFNAETFIIGLAAGVIGVALSYFISVFINIAIYSLAGISGIAALPFTTALIMVAISILLTLVSGLIPAQSAAKKDPVIALRTE